MFYFALLDTSNDAERVIRISVPYESLDQILASLGNSITLIVVVGLIVAILASVLAGDYIRSSFMDLEKAAADISAGSYKKKFRISSDQTLGRNWFYGKKHFYYFVKLKRTNFFNR